VGPWKIEKRDRLVRLRDLARSESAKGETKIDFALRFGGKRPPVDPESDPALAATLRAEEGVDAGVDEGADETDPGSN